MFVLSNKREDKWGRYFHQGDLRKYLFNPLSAYDNNSKAQKRQVKKLLSMNYAIPINLYGIGRSLAQHEKLRMIGLSDEDMALLDQTMMDFKLHTNVPTVLIFDVITNDSRPHLERIDPTVDYDANWESWESDWQVQNMSEHVASILRLDNVNRGMLGTGYTDFTRPSDGSASIETVAIELDNGEFLLGVGWHWYNK